MKILMVGDIVGSPGRKAFKRIVSALKQQGSADFVVANAENSAGGRGLTPELAEELILAGADVLTLGDHTWDQKKLRGYLDSEQRVLRPLNFPPGCPGHGVVTLETAWGAISIANLVGRVFMSPCDCPFRTIDELFREPHRLGRIILADLHAEATSEKVVMGRYLDGRVTCLVGTHTHVQTSDERILPGGTAYITDLGMTGARESTLGRDLDQVTAMFLTGMPDPFKVAKQDPVLEGVIVDVDRESGKARDIRRVREFLQEYPVD